MSNDCVEHKLEIGDFVVNNLIHTPNDSFKVSECVPLLQQL